MNDAQQQQQLGHQLWTKILKLQERYCLWTDQNEFDLGDDSFRYQVPPAVYTAAELVRLELVVKRWDKWVNLAMTR